MDDVHQNFALNRLVASGFSKSHCDKIEDSDRGCQVRESACPLGLVAFRTPTILLFFVEPVQVTLDLEEINAREVQRRCQYA